MGCSLVRHGSNHDVWTNGSREFSVPRHTEINEILAKNVIKQAGGEGK